MLRIAFHLRRPEHVALDQNRRSITAERKCSRVKHRPARNDDLRLPDVGHDLHVRHLGAAGQAGQRERCAHGLEEAASRELIEPLRSALREFAMQHLLKLFAASQFFEAAPIFGAGRILDLLPHRREIESSALRRANVFLARSFPGRSSAIHSDRFRIVLIDAHR